jgi:hypothetical protein
MSDRNPSNRKTITRLLGALAGLAVLGLFLAASGFAYAANQETHDPFCASCHTEPESTFVQRATAAQPVDLASYHKTQETRCIDCHSGPGIEGRLRAELLGGRNALAWYTGTATQPAMMTYAYPDANCLKCHQEVTQRGYVPQNPLPEFTRGREGGEEEGGGNHWHELMARWQAASPSAGACTSCHPGHPTDGSAETGYQNLGATRSECEACHRVIGEGEGEGRE